VNQSNDFSINGDSSGMMAGDFGHHNDSPTSQMIYPSSRQAEVSEPDWIPDEQAESCYKCRNEFNFFFRRHHCHFCRKVFCKNCSTQATLEIGGEPRRVRTCKRCREQHEKYTETLLMQRSLLEDKTNDGQLKAESEHFSKILNQERSTTPMEIKQIGVERDFFIKNFA